MLKEQLHFSHLLELLLLPLNPYVVQDMVSFLKADDQLVKISDEVRQELFEEEHVLLVETRVGSFLVNQK